MKTTEARSFRQLDALAYRLSLGLVLLAVASLAAPGAAVGQDNPHGDLSLECSLCHTTAGWTPLREPLEFEHAEMGLSLERGHANLECVSCHQTLVFGFVPTACVDCHDDAHRGEFGFDCEVCHSPTSWDARRTVHDFHSATLFPLTGTHAAVDCAGCHRREPPFEYALTPTDCLSCHIDDYQSTDDPNHVAAGFPTECQLCHGTVAWQGADFGAGFDHSVLFQLTGRHAQLDCNDCHAAGFAGTPSTCVGCHRADYDATRDPNHQQAGIGTNCEDCHGPTQWEGAALDHESIFPITGSHRGLDCADCHVGGVFQGTPSNCVGCHRDDYNATSDPNHQSAGFGTDCEDCHDTNRWQGASVNHQQFFPLTGQHRNLECEECHADGFAGTPTDCYACHRDDYDNTDDPNHRSAGFGTDCEDCHDPSGWEGASVNHQQFWPLTGEHRNLDCEQCHADGFAGTPTDCNSCHSDDYDNTTDPDHQAAGFPRDCEICHTTSGWGGAEFNHAFPIYSGSHREGQAWDECSDCHPTPGNFSVFDCTACHARGEMDEEHDDVGGYVYDSIECYDCHPTGEEDD